MTFAWAEPGRWTTPRPRRPTTPTCICSRRSPRRWATWRRRAGRRRRALAGLGVRVSPPGTSPTRARRWVTRRSSRSLFDDPVVVDVDGRRATVFAGTRWGEVAQATTPHGLVPLHGTSPTVGASATCWAAGSASSGGATAWPRTRSSPMRLLTADGDVRDLDADHDPELFDALRGGGGGFGLVLSATVELYPVRQVMTAAMFWPIAAPRRCSTTGAAGAGTPAYGVDVVPDAAPAPRRGAAPELTAGPSCASTARSSTSRRGFRRRTSPTGCWGRSGCWPSRSWTRWHLGGPLDVTTSHMDPLDPLPYEADHFLLGELPREGQDAWLSVAATDAGDALAFVDLRPGRGRDLQGARPRRRPEPPRRRLRALRSRRARRGCGDRRISEQLAAMREAVTPWDTGFTAPTFAAGWDPRQRSFDRETSVRVQAGPRPRRPDGVFAGNVVRGARTT